MSARHIAVVNFTRMGDILQSGPFLRAVKRANAHAHLTLIVFDRFREVAERLPMVDRALGFDVDRFVAGLDRNGSIGEACALVTDFLRQAQVQNVDEVYNLSHTPLSATFCSLLGARDVHGMRRTAQGRITVSGDWFIYLLSIMQERRFNPFNLAEIYRRFAPESVGPLTMELALTDHDRAEARALLCQAGIGEDEKYVVLQAGASSPSRQWPVKAFADLSNMLAASGYRSVLVGSPAEQPLARQILAQGNRSLVSLAGSTSIGILAAVLEGAARLISNDTGTIHLAAAVGTPAIGIYLGPAAGKDTAPVGHGHIVIEADIACAPCGYKHVCTSFRCHHAITARDVCALALASGDEVLQIASRMHGIRITRTRVDANGNMQLHRLNVAACATDDAALDFYRSFWDALLGNSPRDLPQMDFLSADAMADLQSILICAQTSIGQLRAVAVSPHPQPETLAHLWSAQTVWQEDLRHFASSHEVLAPLPRFLLVYAGAMRLDSLADYLEDAANLLTVFQRGVNLLQGSVPARNLRGVCDAAAC